MNGPPYVSAIASASLTAQNIGFSGSPAHVPLLSYSLCLPHFSLAFTGSPYRVNPASEPAATVEVSYGPARGSESSGENAGVLGPPPLGATRRSLHAGGYHRIHDRHYARLGPHLDRSGR